MNDTTAPARRRTPSPRARERHVIAALADGRTPFEIAQALYVAAPTVRGDVARAGRRLGAPGTRAAAVVAEAYRQGLPGLPAGNRPPLRVPPRRLAVLRLMADGMSNRQIAEHLGISEPTVIRHGQLLFQELGAVSRAHAVALGFQHQLLPATP